MAAWLLLEPLKATSARELYLVRVTQTGQVEVTPLAIQAKRFATAQAARAFASQWDGALDEYRVVRR